MLHTHTTQPKKWTAYITTYGLWFGTAVLAVYETALASEISVSVYAWFTDLSNRNAQVRSHFEAVSLAQIATIIMAIIAIAVIVGGFEYHHKRVGEPQGLKILLWTVGIQVFILLMGLMF